MKNEVCICYNIRKIITTFIQKEGSGIVMATKSILKTINIRDNKTARDFIEAFEKSKNAPKEDVEYTRKCTEITGDKIKEFFDM